MIYTRFKIRLLSRENAFETDRWMHGCKSEGTSFEMRISSQSLHVCGLEDSIIYLVIYKSNKLQYLMYGR